MEEIKYHILDGVTLSVRLGKTRCASGPQSAVSWKAAVYRPGCADGVMHMANKAIPNMPQSENERTDVRFYVSVFSDSRLQKHSSVSLDLPLNPFSTVKNVKDGQFFIYI